MRNIYKMLLLLAAVLLTPLLTSCEKEEILPDDDGNIETGITITEAKQLSSTIKDGDKYVFTISVTALCEKKYDDWGISLARAWNGTEILVSNTIGYGNVTGSRTFKFELTIPKESMNTTVAPYTPEFDYKVFPCMEKEGKLIYDMSAAKLLALEYNAIVQPSPTIIEAEQIDARKEGDYYIFDISVGAKCDSKFDDWGVSLCRTLNGSTEIMSTNTVGSSNVTGSRTFLFELSIPEENMNTIANPHRPKSSYSVMPYMQEGGKITYDTDGIVPLTLECKPTEGKINGYLYIDLGLPSGLKWASYNVGATAPEEYGNYYAWGETTTKSTYTSDNSKTSGKEMSDISGNRTYDAARANWGSTWRMPTFEEINELINNCTWTWTTKNGCYGRKVTGPNGNSIFLPAAGYRRESSLYDVGEDGYYWSSTPNESNTDYAYILYLHSGNYGWSDRYYRYRGRCVRPVSD